MNLHLDLPPYIPCILMGLILGPTPCGVAQDEVRPRSVLFYLVDTCRADRLSAYGAERETTPFLEEIAAKGVVFEQCRSQAPWTKPSVASMLTSRYPGELGIYMLFHTLDDAHVTLPEAIAGAGYFTAGFAANPLMGAFSNYDQGFEFFVESIAINNADPINFASGSAAKLNAKIGPWLKKDNSWPVFLYVHSVDPHEKYEPAPEYLKQFADPQDTERYRDEWKRLLKSRPPVPGNHLTPANFERTGIDPHWFIEQGKKLYDADILANDAEIERLWSMLQEDGWGEDVILVLTSDHGEEFFEHGGTSHGYSLYDELVRVPLILYAPGLLPEGLRISNPVRLLDVYPTLCDLLGIDVPAGLQGRSLMPLIQGAADWRDLPVMSEKTEDPGGRRARSGMGVGMSIIDGGWKLICNLRSADGRNLPRYELFDLSRDPGEQHNLAGAHPERVVQMDRVLMEWSARNLGLAQASSTAAEEVDPEVLAQLRALGYLGDDEEEIEASPNALSPLARALLEGDKRWSVLVLGPKTEDEVRGRTFGDWSVNGRRIARDARRESLLRLLYMGVSQADEAELAPCAPVCGIQAGHGGHDLKLFISFKPPSLHPVVDGTPLQAVPLHGRVVPGIRALFEEAGLEFPD
jgi:arylsulfatase A-like enzyme